MKNFSFNFQFRFQIIIEPVKLITSKESDFILIFGRQMFFFFGHLNLNFQEKNLWDISWNSIWQTNLKCYLICSFFLKCLFSVIRSIFIAVFNSALVINFEEFVLKIFIWFLQKNTPFYVRVLFSTICYGINILTILVPFHHLVFYLWLELVKVWWYVISHLHVLSFFNLYLESDSSTVSVRGPAKAPLLPLTRPHQGHSWFQHISWT